MGVLSCCHSACVGALGANSELASNFLIIWALVSGFLYGVGVGVGVGVSFMIMFLAWVDVGCGCVS